MTQNITHHSSPVYTDYRGVQDHYLNAQGEVMEQKHENTL